MKKKRVILLNIDSLTPQLLEMASQTGHTPALTYLMNHGTFFPHMVSAFPTMSVTIDTSLLTGTYADQHEIPGLNWFNIKSNEFVNYGTGPLETFKIGWKKSIHNMLYKLNNDHMSNNVTTIFETLASKGYTSASINSFIYRGSELKQLQTPRLLNPLTYFKNGTWQTKGPNILSLGMLHKIRRSGFSLQMTAGNYKFMAKELRHLIQKKQLPHFTFAIFQDLDLRMHFKGPIDVKGLSKIDKEIQKTLNLFTSWETAIKKYVWIIIGDNGHAPMHRKRKTALIHLPKLLNDFKVKKLTKRKRKNDDIAIAVNQRMAYIYILNNDITKDLIINNLLKDKRIDLIAWKEDHFIYVKSSLHNGMLKFKRKGRYTDQYEQKWMIKGNTNILDLTIKNDKTISYNNYPDALARLSSALHSHSGHFIVINAKPGHEFKSEATSVHPGAAHGSLHKQESLVPLIIAGTNKTPEHSRIIDLKPFIEDVIF